MYITKQYVLRFMMFQNGGGIVGCIGHGTYCSGTFYDVRYRHIRFRAVRPYVAPPSEMTCRTRTQYPEKALGVTFIALYLKQYLSNGFDKN
jgi:hypothetical protein